MCGLAGVLGDLNQQHKDLFRDLMDVAQVRGRHSAGVIGVTQRNEYRWAKEVGPPAFLFDTRRYDQATMGFMSALIGHTRHKTVGDITRQTAHPFDYPEQGICGVHNGTLRNYHHLKGHAHNRVDSDVLYEHLAEHGPFETFNDIEGAWACVWWDADTKTIQFIRNDQRPLWFCWTKDSKAMFWASELWMLASIERKIELHDGGDDGKKFIPLPVNTLWSFEVTPNAKDRKVIFKQPAVIQPKEVRGNQGNATGGTGRHGDWVKQPGGHYERVIDKDDKKDDKVVTLGPPKSGGSVPDPFQKTGQDRLDDPLPDNLKPPESGAAGKAIIPISEVGFINSSRKEAPKASLSGSTSTRPLLSPRFQNTSDWGRVAKRRPSDNSNRQPVSTDIPDGKPKVSFRTVLGVDYITDNSTKTEYTEDQFERNTGAVCSYCKEPVGSIRDVHEFIDSDGFVCKACVAVPQIPTTINA